MASSNTELLARPVRFYRARPIRTATVMNFFSVLVLLTACVTPSEHFAEAANELGFVGVSLKSDRFEHQLYANAMTMDRFEAPVLHVYLDGDGTPWERHRWISEDPTSRNPMILELMNEDKTASIFIGRPCYHNHHKAPDCLKKYWTSHRYSKEVVSSMAKVLTLWLQRYSYKRIVLIGFSGGGTLAMLLSTCLDRVDTVVTIASNLDVDAWSRFHGYSPLTGSLDPGTMSFNKRLKQFHLAGLKDEVVPSTIIQSFSARQKNATYIAFADFDHHCCWEQEWKNILTLF